MNRLRRKKAFTMLELLAVLGILILITKMGLTAYQTSHDRDAHERITMDLNLLRNAFHANRVKYLSQGVIKWSDIPTLKVEGNLPTTWDGLTPYGNPYSLVGFDPAATFLTVRVDVKEKWREYVLRRVSMTNQDPASTTGVLMEVTEPGTIPAMLTKMSIYPGASKTEVTMHEVPDFLKGIVARDRSQLNEFRDLSNPVYGGTMSVLMRLKKLVLDEGLESSGDIKANGNNIQDVNQFNGRDGNFDTLRVKKLYVSEFADITAGRGTIENANIFDSFQDSWSFGIQKMADIATLAIAAHDKSKELEVTMRGMQNELDRVLNNTGGGSGQGGSSGGGGSSTLPPDVSGGSSGSGNP